jgi:hypothetical protein
LDIGTTDGRLLALDYEEYDYCSPEAGWAELDVSAVKLDGRRNKYIRSLENDFFKGEY